MSVSTNLYNSERSRKTNGSSTNATRESLMLLDMMDSADIQASEGQDPDNDNFFEIS